MKKFKYSEITPENIYKNRRKFIKNMGLAAGSMFMGQNLITPASANTNKEELKLTDYRYVTTYNNYYEFGTGKSDPAEKSEKFKTTPWEVVIDGEVENPIRLSIEELTKMFPSEERIYKLRCVEGWSMVIPWLGFPLNKILKKAAPTSKGKFVKFTSILDPVQMIGQRYSPPNEAAIIMSTEAIFAAFFGWLILSEFFNARIITGSLLIFIGIVISQIYPMRNYKIFNVESEK